MKGLYRRRAPPRPLLQQPPQLHPTPQQPATHYSIDIHARALEPTGLEPHPPQRGLHRAAHEVQHARDRVRAPVVRVALQLPRHTRRGRRLHTVSL